VIVVTLNHPTMQRPNPNPLDALHPMQLVVHDFAQADDAINIFLAREHCLERRPVAMNVGYDKHLMTGKPWLICAAKPNMSGPAGLLPKSLR
jgi:hypothetical protein